MQFHDVIIVGGGPAGSSCAWRLRRAGLDVVVWDRAAFPRDKVCAGWITPQAVDDSELDLGEYGFGRTLQPITGFRIGVMGRALSRYVGYDRVVSYGIRRCEFDDYLLRRSGARLELGAPASIRREHGSWVVNDRVAAPVLVGAGGHWCPVARLLNPTLEREAPTLKREAPTLERKAPTLEREAPTLEREALALERRAPTLERKAPTLEREAPTLEREASAERPTRSASRAVVVAQETEFPIAREHASAFTTSADTPELYFSSDFRGYGWIFRKQGHVNIGVGSLDPHACPTATVAFVDDLRARGVVPLGTFDAGRWRGHAYRLSQPGRGRASGDGVLLAGDAIGLAYPQSGEGIRPAIESGLLAASTIIDARGDYSAQRLAAYDRRLVTRFGDGHWSGQGPSRFIPEGTAAWLGARLLAFPWFVRHVVLDRWFLRAGEPALTN